MKLVLYGGGEEGRLPELDLRAIEMTGKNNPSITYIPSCSYMAEVDFKRFVNYYKKYGITRFVFFPVDHEVSPALMKEAMRSDIIHLCGGNTFYFLKSLRQSKVLKKLKECAGKGKVITGLSAGAIMLTPSIEMAGHPSFDKDSNCEGIKDLSSLALTTFEFSPHYRNSKRYDQELSALSKSRKNPIYASPDDCGIVLDGDNIKFIGRNYCFFGGKKLVISASYHHPSAKGRK